MTLPRTTRLAASALSVATLVGGIGLAAAQLPKGSVGTRHLKDAAVTGAKVKNDALTGRDIRESTLTTVPAARRATTATRAATATQAATARTVGGVTVQGFSFRATEEGNAKTLFSLGGLTLSAHCSSGRVDARTSVDDAFVTASWVRPSGDAAAASDTDFDRSEYFLVNNPDTGTRTGSVEYLRPDGHRVSVSMQLAMGGTACVVSGHAFAS